MVLLSLHPRTRSRTGRSAASPMIGGREASGRGEGGYREERVSGGRVGEPRGGLPHHVFVD